MEFLKINSNKILFSIQTNKDERESRYQFAILKRLGVHNTLDKILHLVVRAFWAIFLYVVVVCVKT